MSVNLGITGAGFQGWKEFFERDLRMVFGLYPSTNEINIAKCSTLRACPVSDIVFEPSLWKLRYESQEKVVRCFVFRRNASPKSGSGGATVTVLCATLAVLYARKLQNYLGCRVCEAQTNQLYLKHPANPASYQRPGLSVDSSLLLKRKECNTELGGMSSRDVNP